MQELPQSLQEERDLTQQQEPVADITDSDPNNSRGS